MLAVLSRLDHWIALLLGPLSYWILASGLDDFMVDAACLWDRFRRKPAQAPPDLRGEPQRRIAIFLPCWKEHEVIAPMLAHNIGAIEYHQYDIFVGAYPNDEPTLEAVRAVEARHDRVHLAVCPHDGPTSKADCLNWIYQRMLLHEEQHGVRFEMVATHDAEDLVHPHALLWLNHYGAEHDMVQIPVLALPTPPLQMVHGVYCDEFAEFQLRDQRARQIFGSFLPSNGVGTGYSRKALETLARQSNNEIFEPTSLTEDYENGLRLFEAGLPQVFMPVQAGDYGFVATREYFPQRFWAAVRQRTRWVTGIALQGWERHGWRGTAAQRYWFWRDRKGLIGNPISFAANLLFATGLLSWTVCRLSGAEWALGGALQQNATVLMLNSVLQLVRLSYRIGCVRAIYGWRFAAGAPVRMIVANYINCLAAVMALYRFAKARLTGQPLVWLKTTHAYPSRAALQGHRRRIGEVLVANGALSGELLAVALEMQPPGVRLGEYLLHQGLVSETELYGALGQQQGMFVEELELDDVEPELTRALPQRVLERLRILPYRVEGGQLFVAGPEPPTAELHEALQAHTRLRAQFRWITESNYDALRSRLPYALESD